MYQGLIKKIFAAAIFIMVSVVIVYGAYIPTNRDTKMPPEPVSYEPVSADGYVFLESAGDLEYYYRDDRDIFLIRDKRNGYTWKTGLDIPFNNDIDNAVSAASTDEEKLTAAIPKEDRLNTTYIGVANSLLSVELYDDAFNIQTYSSAAQKGAESSLHKIEDGHYRLDVNFTDIFIKVNAHIFLTETGFNVKIYDDAISGIGTEKLAAIIITPFLGASGGVQLKYNPETKDYDIKEPKPMIPGYVFVPDGSGALIRFKDNSVSIKKYVGSVYGVNLSESTYYYSDEAYSVAKKEPVMPVFGIAHGNNQAAFAAWAQSGAEHMEIVMSPHENMTNYNYAYPRFVYNRQMHQVYNRKGEGYFRLYPERLHFDLDMNYYFLAEGGDYTADYAGMALAYRHYLISEGILTESAAQSKMPVRIDFIMSDIKKSVVGHSNVVATTSHQVKDILNDLYDMGISNISSGLLGFQDGGLTAGKPWALNFAGSIGTKKDYSDLFSEMSDKGIDVSFSQNYAQINELQMRLPPNQAYHINNWGLISYMSHEEFVPVTQISYARPDKSAQWLLSQAGSAKKLGAESMTVTGITQMLLSHYGKTPVSSQEAVKLYQNTFEQLDMKINAEAPNMYLWKYVDRFLKTPVNTTQYILETDTVPFLQLVLNGTMEMYSPYANFSFYTKSDMLRMIDYNVYPSFVITYEPAYVLSNTNSLMYYSTEYALYRDIINEVYGEVSSVLNQVAGKTWVGRKVIENGVIENMYDDGTSVYINYTDSEVKINGAAIAPLTAVVTGR